ncbi:MAG: SulP family inorganic anion transporter [Chitinophagales bacterium]|nr:SulP family inorganic anion transporter [Chitinophagales bacterium]MDW8418449.1 SulP family inorganic anion transporter [Chitinophagales bacterium]
MPFTSPNLFKDFTSGIVVFLVALPLCLGIAVGSNAEPIAGLIAGVVGGIVVGALSGSNLSVSGPAAGLTTIVSTYISKLPTYEVFLLGVVLAGLFQIILGYCKAGALRKYVPAAVIKAMLAAIGLILILKQIPHVLGLQVNCMNDLSWRELLQVNLYSRAVDLINCLSPAALAIGILSLCVQILWGSPVIKSYRVLSFIPGPLLAVLSGMLVNYLLSVYFNSTALRPEFLVTIPELDITGAAVNALRFPDFTYLNNATVWMCAITLAIVASLETLLSIEAVDNMDPYRRITPPDRELKAQGAGNIISGLLGGLPLTSVIARSSANVNAGASSKLSTVIHGLLLLLSVYFIPGLLNMIPLASLAGVLIFTGYKLTHPALFVLHYRQGMHHFVPFVVTVVAILTTDLLVGVGIGLLAAYLLRRRL